MTHDGSAENIGDGAPPLPDTFSSDSAGAGEYGPIGRTFVTSAEYKF